MIINFHSAKNFRNISEASFEPHPVMNVIYGENGQGKTNLIESIWLLTGFYSFRSRKNAQLIQQGTSEAEIESNFYSQQREQNVQMKINRNKEITLNGIKEKSPRVMMGKFYAVVFSPNTLGIVQDGPSERRKMIDIATWIVQISVAIITGGFSYLGVYLSVKSSHDQIITDLKSEQQKYTLYIDGIKKDIIRLEEKQDKHNAVIERTFKLEQKVEDLEKRIK